MGFYEKRLQALKSGKPEIGYNPERKQNQSIIPEGAQGKKFAPSFQGEFKPSIEGESSFSSKRRELYSPSFSRMERMSNQEAEYISRKSHHSGKGMSFGDGGGSGALRRIGEFSSSGSTVRAWDSIQKNKGKADEYISRSVADSQNPMNIAIKNISDFRTGNVRVDKGMERNPSSFAAGGYYSSRSISEYLLYDKMTDAEKTAYNYIYGKKGVKAAEEYKESLRDSIENRIAEEAYKADLGNRDKALGNIPARVAFSFGSGIGSAFTGLVDLGRGVAGKEGPRSKAYFERTQELLRSDRSNSKVENVSHDIANAIGYMVPSVAASYATAPAVGASAAGHVGQGLFGLSAAGRGYQEGLQAGGTVGQARLFGLQQGVDEYVTGRLLNGVSAYGGGFLRKAAGNSSVARAMRQGIDRFVKSPAANAVVKNILSAAGDMTSEAAQEFLQNYTEKVSRNLILGEKNEISLKDPDAWYAAFLGAATAGIMNAPGQVVNTVNLRREGRNVDTAEIIEMADSFEDDPEKYSDIEGYRKVVKAKQAIQAIAEKYAAGMEVSDLEKGAALDLAYEAVDYNRENMVDDYDDDNYNTRTASQNDRKHTSTSKDEYLSTSEESGVESDSVPSPDETIEEIARRNQIRIAPVEERAEQFARNGKKAYLENYKKNSSVPLITYDEGFKVAYNVGRYGGRLTEVRHPAFHMLNVDQQNAAYQAGVMDLHHVRNSRKNQLSKGAPNVGGLIGASEFSTQESRVFADHVGKKTGLKIEIVDKLPYDANGSYISKKGTIQIAYNAENFNAAMSHELSHFIKDYSPKKYEVFQSESVQALANSQGLDFEGLISEYQARYEESGTAPTREEIIDEITNDSIAHVLNDKEFVDRIAKRDKTLSQKIVDFLSDVIEAIDKLISTVKGNKAADALRANRQAYKKAADLWFEALDAAGEKRRSGASVLQGSDADILFSIRSDENGDPVVVIDQRSIGTAFRNDKESARKKLKTVLAVKVNDGKTLFQVIKSSGKKVFLGPFLPGKFAYSGYSKGTRLNTFKKKAELAPHLEEMLEISVNEVFEEDRNGKHGNKAKNGWYKYDSRFAFPVMDSNRNIIDYDIYSARMIVRHDANGRYYLYDITTIEKDSARMPSSLSEGRNVSAKSSKQNIPEVQDKVNTKNVNTSEKSDKGEYDAGSNREESQNSGEGKAFSLRLNSDVDIKKLQKDNERLRKVGEGLRSQFKLTKGYQPNEKEVRKLAKDILSETSSKYSIVGLVDNLSKVFKYINENGENYSESVIKATSSLAREILEESQEIVEDDGYKEIKDRLRGYTIRLSDSDVSNLRQFDGYGAVRRRYFGSLKFSKTDGFGIDQVYAELSQEFPWAFDPDVLNPIDQLEVIMNVVDDGRAIYSNPYSHDMDEASYLLAQEIFEKYFDVGAAAPTFADKRKAELEKAKADHKKALKELREDLRAKNAEKIAKIKEKHRQAKERQAEKNKLRKSADNLLKQARLLSKLKGRDEFIREKQALIGDLDLIAKGMTEKTRLNLESILAEVERMKVADKDFIASRDVELKLSRLNKKQISSLTADEMIDLTQAIVELRHAQETANKMLGKANSKTVSELGQRFIEEMQAVKGTNVAGLSYKKDKYIFSMLDPIRAFKKMVNWQDGAVLVKLGEDLNHGQLKKSGFEMRANKLFNPHMENREFAKGLKRQNIKIVDSYGQEALISPAMRISLYLHSLNDDNMRHMGYGGVIVPNAKLYNKGKIAESYGQGSSKIILKRTQIEEIVSHMTEEEKDFAKTAKYFFNEVTKEAINSTSLALDGYSKAVVDDYFPIKTDRDFNRIDVSGLIKDGTIEGMGMLKERVGSMNPILLEDVTNVITRQIENTAMYYGLAIPVRNFNKVYNFGLKAHENSVRRAITQKWGLQGKEYIEKTLRDIQGARPQISVFGKYRNHFAGAVLTANISVTLKQFASFPTAAAELDWGSVAKSLTPLAGKVDRDLVDKYSPLLWLRSQGDTNPEFGYISKQAPNFDHRGIAAKVKKMFNWIQAMDTFTVGRVWKASEFYVSKHYPYMEKGSDRYYRKVAEIFNNAVEKTQPNYSVMQRPQALRNESELVRSLTMFMTQRLQNFGILEDARGELLARQKEHNLHGSAKTLKALRRAEARFNRAVASQIVSVSMVSAINIIAKLALYKPKDYKDDDEEISPEKMLQQFLLGVVSSTAGNVIGGSELFNAVYGVATGKKPYEIKVPAIELLSNVYEDSTSFAIELTAAFSGEKPLEEKSARLKNAAKSFAYSVASVRGVPVKNAEQLINAIILHTKDMIHGEFGSFKGADNKEKKSGADEVFMTMYEKGDYDTFIKEYNRAVIRSKDKEKIDRELQRRLAATDEVKQIAEAIANGDEKQAEKIRKDLEDKGFKGKLAPLLENAVQSAMRVRSKDVDGAEKSNIPKDFDISNTDETITESKNEKLVSWMEKGGDLEDFLIFDQAVKAVKADMDKNGAAIPGSKKSKVIGIIDGMDIPEDLKDHLFISQGYSAKSLVDAPWNSVEGAPTKEDLLKDDLPKWMQEDSSYLQNAGFSKDRADKWAQDIGNIKNIVNNSGEVVTKRQDQVAQYINNLPVSYVDKDKIWLIYYSDRNLPDWSN